MSNTRLRAADLADEFRSISSDKRMEYVPAQAVHLLIAADMLDENAKLQEQLESVVGRSFRTADKLACLEAENDRLRQLVRDMWHDGMCECDERWACATCEYGYLDRMRELGIEVD